MKIESKEGPLVLNPARPLNSQTSKDVDRRSRAMTALMSNAPVGGQQTPVQNPSSISPVDYAGLQASIKTEQSNADNGQNNVIETSIASEPAPRVETRAPAIEENPLSQHYAILARKEKALRAKVASQEQAIRDKENAIRSQEEALKARELEYQSKYISKDRLMDDPLAVLSDSGISYDNLTERLLNPQQQQMSSELRRYQARLEAKIEADLQALKDEQQKAYKAQEEAKSTQYQQALNQIHYDVKAAVQHDPNFETIRETGSTRDVVELIERVYKKDGVLLTVEEACTEVESYLMEEAEKIFKINKIKNKFRPAASAPAQVAKPVQSQQQPQGMKTLTNSVTSTKKLSARERAVLKFQGKLN